ncbi:MAG: PDZ domain-containing protein [Phycisphaeraceae bacterium]|nr:PDZ domain-containing protein [Phycisphaeraceae bacterium]
MNRRWTVCVVFAALGASAPGAIGTPPALPSRQAEREAAEPTLTREEHEEAFLKAMRRGDLEGAERTLLAWTRDDADNFVPWYNLACVLSIRGKLEPAAEALQQSVVKGFADFHTLTTDPDLRHLRGTETYKAIVEGWDRIIDSRIDAQLDAARKIFRGTPGRPYTFEKDEALRLAYISALDATTFAQARQEIALLAHWWETLVLPEDEPLRSGRRAPIGPEGDGAARPAPPWVTIVLPSRPDYLRWVTQRYGAAGEGVGGVYSHDEKRLVAMDAGSTLRHEYWHALHWRHMDQLGQRHPVWVMEGLCSLVEDVEPAPGGFRALPSWRTNMARRLAMGGALMPWEVLFEMGQRRFVGTRPLAYYAQARAVFMFLSERGVLRDWYTAYVRGYSDDRSGARAMEQVFGTPLAEVEKQFRAWLREVPTVAEEIRPGMANLPVDVSPGVGDGIVIDSTPRGKAGRESGLRLRDVITAIDGHPVRDMNDYIRLIGDREPGERVRISYRRGKIHAETTVELIKQPG